MSNQENELSTQYDPKAVEQKLYDLWLKEEVFRPASDRGVKARDTYCIIMPPPNVTGVLHMGHALTCTLEDILSRWRRMQGYDTLWLPGTDHAGIATQMVVERQLMKEHKQSRHDLGREKFVEKVWEWKEQSQGTILGQMRLMGCGTDWSRLKFTLDDSVSRAVRECFNRLYEQGLISRELAIIQWCPRCRTALSDLEVKAKELKGKLWHIRYLFKDNPKDGIVVATTRPETMLGDLAVAVHPDDERYAGMKGKLLILPLVNREIPIIQDSYVDKEFGSGAVKITPAHDPNDYAIGKRHGLSVLTVMDESAHMNEHAGVYKGLSREKAREKVLADLSALGLLVKEQENVHSVGHCDRCGTIVEPRVSQQWFVNAAELAKEAIRVVEQKEIKILPEEWEKTYFEWMRNIRPWCISRQLWWGHRIPAWYCSDCGEITVARDTPSGCKKCKSTKLKQDEDVLDTWFSSGLWPISTLGWPEVSNDLKRFYPTSVMETGFDILFFWVARMIMLGIRMTGKIPFHTVYLHPMVRDEYGQKMSKTKGNVKDPLEFVRSMGADALRFTLTAMAVHGRDVLLSDARVEGYRNFVNKIWNASRFVEMHFAGVEKSHVDKNSEINRWIWSRYNDAVRDVNVSLENFRFFEAADRLYHFIWSDYCDWFIEFIKYKDELDRRKATNESTAVEVLEGALRLLHPIMPFVTEAIWQRLKVKPAVKCLALAPYPEFDEKLQNRETDRRVGRVIKVVESVRSKRGENNLAPSEEIGLTLAATEAILGELSPFAELIKSLVKAREINLVSQAPSIKDQVVVPLDDVQVLIPREDLIDLAVETARVEKELEGSRVELDRANKKLESPEFKGKAPKEVIDGVRDRKEVLEKKIVTLDAYLKELRG
jgi:valyl-tRNA synthetase